MQTWLKLFTRFPFSVFWCLVLDSRFGFATNTLHTLWLQTIFRRLPGQVFAIQFEDKVSSEESRWHFTRIPQWIGGCANKRRKRHGVWYWLRWLYSHSMMLLQVNDESFCADNYAGIFNCKKTDSVFSYSVTFWSRTRDLSNKDVRTMKAILSQYDVDFTELEDVFQFQDGCGAIDPVVRMVNMTLIPLLGLWFRFKFNNFNRRKFKQLS